jgi:hypothetical protein
MISKIISKVLIHLGTKLFKWLFKTITTWIDTRRYQEKLDEAIGEANETGDTSDLEHLINRR